ncbi:MAG: hypothetical protein C0510_05950 [Erythrobacter sp.]|nr:hypothetical protein [Erythrobacter sp.]
MSVERGTSSSASLQYLIKLAGARRIAVLGVLLVLSGLTEGLGLLTLVPLTQLLAGDTRFAGQGGWLAGLETVGPVQLLLIVVGLVCLRAGLVHLASESRRRLGLDITRQLRNLAHGAVMRADWRWLSTQGSADHAALIMGEADRAGMLADRALTVAALAVTLAILLLTALVIAPPLAGVMLAAAALLSLPLLVLQSRKGARADAYLNAYLRLQRVVGDGIAKLRAARIAGAGEALASEFESASDALRQHELDYFRLGHLLQMLFQMLAAALLACAIYLALFVWQTPLAVFVPVLAIAIRSVPLVASLLQALRGWSHVLPALGSLRELIAQARAHQEPEGSAGERLNFGSEITLEKVSLHHAGRSAPVLSDFSLSIVSGSVTAVTGPSGSGKSSLADMLCGLYAPDSGELRVDGVALDPARRLAWRGQVAYLEQVPFFLDATLAENLAWGLRQVDDARIARALAAASAEFVRDLPDGLATRMGERGRQFSGGEKQRIALARALLRNPDLLILDEVTASLDAANAAAVRQSIAGLRGARTIVLLTHDRKLLALADSVIELGNNG